MNVVRGIIFCNVLVFILWYFPSSIDPVFMEQHFLVSYDALIQGRVWTLLTSVFSHYLFFHFFINMYVFYGFGYALEKIMGPFAFFRFYLLAGIFSSLGHCFASYYLMNDPRIPALGASGAVSGVILLFSLFFPKEKLLLLGLIPVPAITGALIFVGLDLWGLIAQSRGSGLPIGFGAHLGGAIFGCLYFLRTKFRSKRTTL